MRLTDPAYVISLDNKRHRLLRSISRLQEAGFIDIRPHVVKAPSKGEFQAHCFKYACPPWAKNRKLRHAGEYGALRSHKEVLSMLLAEEKEGFVFEDDIILCKDFKKAFDYASQSVKANWIYLGSSQRRWEYPATIPSYRANLTLGAFAYWICPTEASILINSMMKFNCPVDQFYGRFMQHQIEARVCFPNLVIADVRESSTGHGYRDLERYAKLCKWKLERFNI